MEVIEFINNNKSKHDINYKIVPGAARSTYYKSYKLTTRESRNEELKSAIKRIYKR